MTEQDKNTTTTTEQPGDNRPNPSDPPGPETLGPDFAMGGQAVLEGVMMRGPRSYAVAVRRPQGDIVMISRPFLPIVKRRKWLALPILRGAVSLIEMMFLGYRTLEYSANVAEQGFREMEAQEEADKKGAEETQETETPSPHAAAATTLAAASAGGLASEMPQTPASEPTESEPAIGRWQMAGIFVVSMALAMLLFVALPNAATHLLGMLMPQDAPVSTLADGTAATGRATDTRSGLVEVNQPLLYNLVSGAVRVCVIVAYIWLISLMKDIRRLFQYHGAEHKVVMAFEKKIPLDLEHIRPVTTLHPRCGTTFIAVVILVSIVFFAFLTALILDVWPGFSAWSFWARKPLLILMHIILMPLVGGVAYEITRRAGRRPDFWLYRPLLAPGFAFQRITTREPDDSMIEVALQAFHEALEPKELAESPPAGAA